LWFLGVLAFLAVTPSQRHYLRESWPWVALFISALFITPLAWWWHGAQVADVIHQRVLTSIPLSHGVSLNEFFHFLGLELFYLCPLFVILLVVVLGQMGRELWENPRYALLLWLAVPGLVWQNFNAFFGRTHFDLVPALCPAARADRRLPGREADRAARPRRVAGRHRPRRRAAADASPA
jgi:hypothetical protein